MLVWNHIYFVRHWLKSLNNEWDWAFERRYRSNHLNVTLFLQKQIISKISMVSSWSKFFLHNFRYTSDENALFWIKTQFSNEDHSITSTYHQKIPQGIQRQSLPTFFIHKQINKDVGLKYSSKAICISFHEEWAIILETTKILEKFKSNISLSSLPKTEGFKRILQWNHA